MGQMVVYGQQDSQRRTKFCHNCGSVIDYESVICPNCGAQVANLRRYPIRNGVSEKNWLAALLLCLFCGGLGIHRFYVGKIGTGILWLLTGGCLGIGSLVDLIMIAVGKFTDADGLVLSQDM